LISNSSARSKRAAESADAAPVPRRKSTPPFTPEQNKEPDEGRRALCEAFEEDAYRRYPVFKPAILSGFQNAAVTFRAATPRATYLRATFPRILALSRRR
jgi:hypothetical protein